MPAQRGPASESLAIPKPRGDREVHEELRALTGIAGLTLGGGFARLAKVKAAWDPHNMFRANKIVAPAGG
jgi:hypothetical protein